MNAEKLPDRFDTDGVALGEIEWLMDASTGLVDLILQELVLAIVASFTTSLLLIFLR